MNLIHTHSTHGRLSIFPRFRRLVSTSLFRASRSSSDSIDVFFIPTRKHLAKRQQLHERRYLYDIRQSPSS
jgi:hypothetical protein